MPGINSTHFSTLMSSLPPIVPTVIKMPRVQDICSILFSLSLSILVNFFLFFFSIIFFYLLGEAWNRLPNKEVYI